MSVSKIPFPVLITIMVFACLLSAFIIADRHIVSDLNDLDDTVLIWINTSQGRFFDQLMLYAGRYSFWIPFYCAITLFALSYDKIRFMRFFLFLGLYLVAQITFVYLINLEFQHLRPLYQQSLIGFLEIESAGVGDRLGCLPMSSNAAGIALFVCLYFKKQYWPLKVIVVSWALLLLYASLYNGWNYPHEILVSVVISLLIARLMFSCYQYYSKKGALL